MRKQVADDMAWARQAFIDNWHRVAPLIGGGELIHNEDATVTGSGSALDIHSGIDWYIRQTVNGITTHIPLAARVQNAHRAWASFTVREKRDYGSRSATELHKRNIERATPGSATPHFVCQMYVDKNPRWQLDGYTGNFVLAGIVKQADILAAIEAGLYTRKRNEREHGRPVDFLVVFWINIRENDWWVGHVTGLGVSLETQRRRTDPVVRRRRPCPGCGYWYCVHGSHHADCTVEQITELEAKAALATVFDPQTGA